MQKVIVEKVSLDLEKITILNKSFSSQQFFGETKMVAWRHYTFWSDVHACVCVCVCEKEGKKEIKIHEKALHEQINKIEIHNRGRETNITGVEFK